MQMIGHNHKFGKQELFLFAIAENCLNQKFGGTLRLEQCLPFMGTGSNEVSAYT
jgi:hypothetical protein